MGIRHLYWILTGGPSFAVWSRFQKHSKACSFLSIFSRDRFRSILPKDQVQLKIVGVGSKGGGRKGGDIYVCIVHLFEVNQKIYKINKTQFFNRLLASLMPGSLSTF
jgi:hypothetical protein